MSAFGREMQPAIGTGDGGRVLVADDDDALQRAFSRILTDAGHEVSLASDGREAADMVRGGAFDAIVSDLRMPRLGGIELLRVIRERDADLPVIIVTAIPDVATAIEAIEYGAYRYIPKPVTTSYLRASVQSAVGLRRMARLKREALDFLGPSPPSGAERAGLEAAFGRALDTLWLAYQPIVRPGRREVFGYEVLLRSREAFLPEPRNVVEAAERLGRLPELGGRVRALAGASTPEWDRGVLFLNVHPKELDDE
jgi:CheY-like chemotaxis protein